ncbi:hypothetical protein [Streptomyces cadmiisoli]|uniref:hypothetical protein n=1 Tax=Streptomyces cadmiisoli TaxID=2184053 RepID=UPI00365D2142
MAGLYRDYQRVADHRKVAASAKEQPGQWQLVGLYRNAETARATSIHVTRGHLAAYAPAGSFQAFRSVSEEGRRLWVRFVDGITPPAELPEELPVAARVVLTGYAAMPHFVSANWAADHLAEQGYAEDADLIRGWLAVREGRGPVGPREAATYLLQHHRPTREDGTA